MINFVYLFLILFVCALSDKVSYDPPSDEYDAIDVNDLVVKKFRSQPVCERSLENDNQ